MGEFHINISVVVTAHHEGRLAHRTMRSLFRAVEFANGRGLRTEIIVVMDKPDRATAEYFATYISEDIRVETVAFGDPGLSRNHGVEIALGNYIAFLDADNLFGEDWLHKAYQYLESTNKYVVMHPQYYVVFEMENLIWRQISSTDAEFNPLCLLESNYWDTVCVAKREIFLDNPFAVTTQSNGFGFEDWHFNCETLANGIEHYIVPETSYFIRRKKSGSQMADSLKANRLMRPTKLFEPAVLSAFIQRRENDGHFSACAGLKLSYRAMVCRRLYHQRRHFKKPIELMFKLISRFKPNLEPIAKGFVEGVKLFLAPTEPLPRWLLEEWRAMNVIEPQLFPATRLVDRIACYTVPESHIGRRYLELCRLYGEKVSHVFLVPWLKKGGADLEVINYIQALAGNRLAGSITVIADQNTDSPWATRLPAGINFVEFGKICRDLANEEQEKLLSRLLLQMAPSVVHNINSDLGYRIFTRYGMALRFVSRLYATSFCDDISAEGKIVGYPSRYLPECFDQLSGVFCDCRSFADRLHDMYAFDRGKLFVHYQPCQVIETRNNQVDNKTKKNIDILWAGRLDRQKRPDILVGIAAACEGLPVRFHVYGSPLLDADRYLASLRKLPNVTYHGAFDGLLSVPVDKYDLFLYTSQWDGFPNILLEAVTAGLPVIAPDVGGIGELIINNKTGFLVDQFDDVAAYVSCIRSILQDSSNLGSFAENAAALVKQRHSFESFVESICASPGYIQ